MVDIEIKTIELVFGLLEADIETFDMSVAKKWANGEAHYRKRISVSLEKLREIDRMVDKVIAASHVTMKMLTSTDAGATEMRSSVLNLRSAITKKLTILKQHQFVKDMRVHGYSDYNMPDSKRTYVDMPDDGDEPLRAVGRRIKDRRQVGA